MFIKISDNQCVTIPSSKPRGQYYERCTFNNAQQNQETAISSCLYGLHSFAVPRKSLGDGLKVLKKRLV